MKTTLFTLLLFLSCNLMGQIDPRMEAFLDTAAYEISEAHEFGLEGIIFTNKDYINAKIDKRIVELWKEYQVKCKADTGSFMWYDYEYMTKSTIENMDIYNKIDGRWFFRRKPTLPGLMLFIECKTTSK